ncbi:cytochrome d ubiquinol oxidase subunit II [Gryllotalpicola ginsengisoli]|uniref:cytochrome d ubiquinol oxidase subunit II n=1 Tax=Gryllotalpicola ginsengisoli TaxID=444608 RepID=UPI0003B4BD10|nr:cytochrome d ubiquinol oxidase subunit II [Gryllotalpicola ginsengisoli]
MSDFLPTLWFILIAVLWIGYLFLEGFDLGVGMHMVVSARDERERRLMLNTIGPVWDGNEVWLITAGGALFAAYPFWYASLFSALYIPLVAVLLGLIFRAVAIEYRGKGHTERWTMFWTWAIGLGSFVSAFGVGAALALTSTGLPLDKNGDMTGGPFAWLNGWAVLGGLAVVGFALLHAANFLALKTEGPVRERAGRFAWPWGVVCLLPVAVWAIAVVVRGGSALAWVLLVLAVVAVVWWAIAARAGREGLAFATLGAFLVLGAAAIFASMYPVVLPSTTNHAWDLTVQNASSAPYTLGVMSVVAAFGVPIVLAYQAWTYWVFRKRLSSDHIPANAPFSPAVAPAAPQPFAK